MEKCWYRKCSGPHLWIRVVFVDHIWAGLGLHACKLIIWRAKALAEMQSWNTNVKRLYAFIWRYLLTEISAVVFSSSVSVGEKSICWHGLSWLWQKKKKEKLNRSALTKNISIQPISRLFVYNVCVSYKDYQVSKSSTCLDLLCYALNKIFRTKPFHCNA